MPLDDLFKTVSLLKERIVKYRGLLEKNEALTRYALVDPFLRAMGWETDNPEHVLPEFVVDDASKYWVEISFYKGK